MSKRPQKLPKHQNENPSPPGNLPWEKVKCRIHHIQQIFVRLEQEFGKVETPLHYSKDYELGIAVILSAQCTDERVNQVTPKLFQAFPTLRSFAEATPEEIEPYIFSTGFYRNKARSISGYARQLLEVYDGIHPKTLDELTQLPGFGRKTANVVLNVLYDISEGFVVDTHVKRLTYRLGLTRYKDPIRIEKEILDTVPRKYWNPLSLYLIFHGRKTCNARKPLCGDCKLSDICPSDSHRA